MKIIRIEHVAIATPDASESKRVLSLFGLVPSEHDSFPELGAERTAYRVGGTELELLQGAVTTPVIGAWLREHGAGLCHIALTVEDLDEALAELGAAGVRPLAPASVSRGRRTAFLDPTTTADVFYELVEELSA